MNREKKQQQSSPISPLVTDTSASKSSDEIEAVEIPAESESVNAGDDESEILASSGNDSIILINYFIPPD